MLSRFLSRLTILASIAVLAGASYFFIDTYRELRDREQLVRSLAQLAADEGPCAALLAARHVADSEDAQLHFAIRGLRAQFAAQIVGAADAHAARALLSADREGLIDYDLCEQIRLSRSLDEMHPVLALLRYTREGGSPCDDEAKLPGVLDGLGSHRPVMLHALMRDVPKLRCLSPALREKIAALVVDMGAESPRSLDDLDVLRVAAFLSEAAPLAAAQLGCLLEARGDVSRLANALDCPPDAKRRVLVRYQVRQAVPGTAGAPALAEGSLVLLLREREERCVVMPATGASVAYVLPCDRLRLASDILVGVCIDAVSYGDTGADLLAGLGTYVAAESRVVAATRDPATRSWFGYGREGQFLGPVHVTDLDAVAVAAGEAPPQRPLRAQCERSGAKYCYDVDWLHTVSRLEQEPVLFLSQPAPVFLRPESDAARALTLFAEGFGRPAAAGASWHSYALAQGGALASEAQRDSIEVRWRLRPAGPWRVQSFGHLEGGAAPPSARLLALLDMQRDGRPELVVQRVLRTLVKGEARDSSDEVLLLDLPDAGAFRVVNRLTIREF